MKITKKPNLTKKQKQISSSIEKAIELSGTGIINAFKKRIKSGTNDTGGRFKQLDPTYKTYKQAKGKNAMFEFSGDMLRSLTYKRISKGEDEYLRIYFDDNDMLKRASYNYQNGRKFMYLNKSEENILYKNLKKEINKIL